MGILTNSVQHLDTLLQVLSDLIIVKVLETTRSVQFTKLLQKILKGVLVFLTRDWGRRREGGRDGVSEGGKGWGGGEG